MTPDTLTRVGAVIAAVPSLLGFTPSNSVVVIVLGSTRPTVRLTMRIDVPDTRDITAVVSQLRAALAKHSADRIITVIVADTEMTAGCAVLDLPSEAEGSAHPALPHQAFVAELCRMTHALGIGAHAVWVDRIECGRPWRCYDDAHCTGVIPDPRCSPAAVSAAMAGTVLYGSREELAAQIAADPPPILDRRAALLRQQQPMPTEDAIALIDDTVHHLSADPAGERFDDDAFVQLAHALTCTAVRDAAIAFALTEHAVAAERLWTLLTRATPRPQVTLPATLLSVSALLRGNGALANVALDTALAADPNNGLAQLLRCAVDTGVSPDVVRQLLTDSLTA